MGHNGHLFLPIGPKNTDLVKDVEILLPVKFRRILFSGFREEVKNVSANQRLPTYLSLPKWFPNAGTRLLLCIRLIVFFWITIFTCSDVAQIIIIKVKLHWVFTPEFVKLVFERFHTFSTLYAVRYTVPKIYNTVGKIKLPDI